MKTPEQIIFETCFMLGVDKKDLLTDKVHGNIPMARQICVYRLCTETMLKNIQIGVLTGYAPSSVKYNRHKVHRLVSNPRDIYAKKVVATIKSLQDKEVRDILADKRKKALIEGLKEVSRGLEKMINNVDKLILMIHG